MVGWGSRNAIESKRGTLGKVCVICKSVVKRVFQEGKAAVVRQGLPLASVSQPIRWGCPGCIKRGSPRVSWAKLDELGGLRADGSACGVTDGPPWCVWPCWCGSMIRMSSHEAAGAAGAAGGGITEEGNGGARRASSMQTISASPDAFPGSGWLHLDAG